MKARIATFYVAPSAMRRSPPGRDGSHGYPVPGFAGHLDCRVARRIGVEAER